MSDFISEEKIEKGKRQIDWLINNTNEDNSKLSSDKDKLKRFYENVYGTSANENINGGKPIKSQILDKENILMKVTLMNIEAKYNSYRQSSNTKKQ